MGGDVVGLNVLAEMKWPARVEESCPRCGPDSLFVVWDLGPVVAPPGGETARLLACCTRCGAHLPAWPCALGEAVPEDFL